MIYPRVQDVRNAFCQAYKNEEFVFIGNNRTGSKTVELVNFPFIADEATIFGELNKEFVEREQQWYDSESLNVEDFPGGAPQIWKAVADPQGWINSNYGWCVYSGTNGHQYLRVANELKKDPTSRRAIMIYTRPSMWDDYNRNGRMDFMCTNTVQYLIRRNTLITIVEMRSNDAVYGFKNDLHWQKTVQQRLLTDLQQTHPNLLAGQIYWKSGSLHVYERHFSLIEKEFAEF